LAPGLTVLLSLSPIYSFEIKPFIKQVRTRQAVPVLSLYNHGLELRYESKFIFIITVVIARLLRVKNAVELHRQHLVKYARALKHGRQQLGMLIATIRL
jgi:hypothetical protein